MSTSPVLPLLVGLGLFVSFLVLLAVLAVAVTKGLRGRIEREEGAQSCAPGCALAGMLAFLCLMGALGFAAFFLSLGLGTALSGPEPEIEYVEPESFARVRFSMQGGMGSRLTELVEGVVGEPVPLEVRRRDAAGVEFAVYEFVTPLRGRSMRELEAELAYEIEKLQQELPEGVVLELQQPVLVD